MLTLAALAAAAPAAYEPLVRELRFLYRDPATGTESPVQAPAPDWFLARARLQVGEPYSQAAADADLVRFTAIHKVLCLEVRPEPVAGGVRAVYVFQQRPLIWTIRVVAAERAPSVDQAQIMEAAVTLHQNDPVDLYELDASRRKIVEFLRRQGCHFVNVDARYNPVENRPGFVSVTFEVDSGPTVRPKSITFTGNRAFSRDELLALMQTREDHWYTSRRFVQATYDADIERIRRHYVAKGWEDAEVAQRPVLFDPEPVAVVADYETRGGRTTVTRLRIDGTETVRTRLIRDQFETRPGAEFTRERFERDLEPLRARYREAGFRADPADVAVVHQDLGAGRGRSSARLLFARARESVTIDLALRRGADGAPTVDRISLVTAGPYADEEVARLIALRVGSRFTEDALLSDCAAVARFYAAPSRGYALVDRTETQMPASRRVELAFQKKGRTALLRIDIREGGRYMVESVAFEGVQPVFEHLISGRLALRQGALFTRAALDADVETIRRTYHEEGYAEAQVTGQETLRPGTKTFDVKYVVKEGPVCYVDLIRPRGNDKTRPTVITREMAIQPGDRYDLRKIEESVRRLRNLGFFRHDDQVQIQVVPVDSRREEPGRKYKDLMVQVQEVGAGYVHLGAGASSALGVFGELAYQDTNFDLRDPPRSWADFVSGQALTGGGQTLALRLQPGTKASRLELYWKDPWLNDKPVELEVSAGYFSRDWDAYIVDKIGFDVQLARRDPLQPARRVFVGVRAHVANVHDVSGSAPDEIRDDRGTHGVLGLRAGLASETLDDRALPTDGAVWTLSSELLATPAPDAVKLQAAARRYFTVYKAPDRSRHVIALWGETAAIVGGDVPVFEKLYGGGIDSVRGFATHGISPRKSAIPGKRGDAIGGRLLVEGGAEYLFPIVRDSVRGVVFLDAGSVAEDSFGVSDAFSDLRVSAGIGAHVLLPGQSRVPLRIYLGFPLKKVRGDDTETFSFSIGFLLR